MKKTASLLLAILVLSGCQWSQLPDQSKQEQEPKGENNEKLQGSLDEQQQERNKPSSKQAESKNEVENKEAMKDELTLEASYFNEVNEVNGKREIQNSDNMMALVNKEYALPGKYAPKDLVRPKVAFPFGDQDLEKSYLRKEAAEALEKMFAAAQKEGLKLYASSGYRSFERQQTVFHTEVSRVGEEKASQAVAFPGNSEHQTGLAMDITSENVQFQLNEQFGSTQEGKWLQDNAHLFGFILRYPKGKESITGYQYEPWHFRYVGKKAARVIYENNWTLEEYFKRVKKI